MTRIEILSDLSNYFKVHELVGRRTYETLGEDAWQVFDTDTLHCLLIMRKGINKPFSINNWFWGGQFSQRGFRSNISQIVKDKTLANKIYLSGHPIGKAFDFQVTGVDAELVRNWIEAHASLFPCKIRLEWRKNGVPISWVHFDTKYKESNPKVYKFDV